MMKMTNIAKGAALAAATATMILSPARAEAPAPHPLPAWVNTPCADEGSTNCYWDAGSAGNGGGHSYIVARTHTPSRRLVDCVYYTEAKYARNHNYCD